MASRGRGAQAWQIKNGTPVSVGLPSNHSGANAFCVAQIDADAIALSDDPGGGSPQPTATPFLVKEF